MFLSFRKRTGWLIHRQPRRLQGGHAIAQIADILPQKAGAHFSSSSLGSENDSGDKCSVSKSKNIKFF
jgi:hypothetical protein